MGTLEKIGVGCFFGWIFVIAWGISFWGFYVVEWSYPYSKHVDANYTRAKTTSDLGEAADYLQDAYDWLDSQDFEGNPDIIFPTDETNWKLIMSDFKDLIKVTKKADNNSKPGDDSYEEALRELDEKVDNLKNQTGDNFGMEFHRTYLIQEILWSIFFFPLLLILAAIFIGLDD